MASDGSDHSQAEDAEAVQTVKIAQVFAVTIGRTVWYPDVQTAQGTVYFKLAKHDRTLAKVVLGKAINRHKKHGAVRTIRNKQWWPDMQQLRKQACNDAYHAILRGNMEHAGQVIAENQKFRDAEDDDRWLVGQSQVELNLPAVEGHQATTCQALWQTKGELWLELNESVVKYCVAALKASDDVVKASPKRKRRRKRDCSKTPKKDRRVSDPFENADGPVEPEP